MGNLQETLHNTFKVNNPLVGTIVEFLACGAGAGLDQISGVDGRNFSSCCVLQSLLIKTSCECLDAGIDTSKDQEFGEDVCSLLIKVSTSSVTLDTCLDAARRVSWIRFAKRYTYSANGRELDLLANSFFCD